MIIVSACLAGVNCNYKGSNYKIEKIAELVENGEAVVVCPEALGGLGVPRIPVELINGRAIRKDNEDVTDAFLIGAEKTLEFCKKHNCKKAILKSKSPSCGCGKVYDGTFTSTIIDGDGITTKLLKENGIEVISSDEF
ncbi:MAG: DUF523 domain-containing protein [Oscillospiraceae bacterium]|nr:DUF523 domain-containing protein [Oscillospiraceae bacterium]